MTLTSRWRDRQLNSFTSINHQVLILEQEKIMLDFIQSCPTDTRWKWQGSESNFKNICKEQFTITDYNYNGIILFGTIFYNISTSQLVKTIRESTQNVNFSYIGINRYELSVHDIDIELSEDIDDSIDKIMNYCDHRIIRLHNFLEVDGHHMVAAHPMDCYKLCK
jgi:hypothetical protein